MFFPPCLVIVTLTLHTEVGSANDISHLVQQLASLLANCTGTKGLFITPILLQNAS
jgi:hypothetical protein